MPDFVSDGHPIEPTAESALQSYETMAPSIGAELGAQFNDGPFSSIWRWGQRRVSDEIAKLARPLPGYQPMEPADANELYAPKGVDLFDRPVVPETARLIAQAKRDEIQRESILSRYANSHSLPINLATGVAGFVLDPLNIGATFIPGVGEEAVGAAVLRAGFSGVAARVATRAITGLTTGAAFQAPLSAIKYGTGLEEDSDYGMQSAFYDLAMNAAVVAAFHVGLGGVFGSAVDRLKKVDPQTNNAAIRSAAAQIVEGRSVNVDPVFHAREGTLDPAVVIKEEFDNPVKDGLDSEGAMIRAEPKGTNKITDFPEGEVFENNRKLAVYHSKFYPTEAGITEEQINRAAKIASEEGVSVPEALSKARSESLIPKTEAPKGVNPSVNDIPIPARLIPEGDNNAAILYRGVVFTGATHDEVLKTITDAYPGAAEEITKNAENPDVIQFGRVGRGNLFDSSDFPTRNLTGEQINRLEKSQTAENMADSKSESTISKPPPLSDDDLIEAGVSQAMQCIIEAGL